MARRNSQPEHDKRIRTIQEWLMKGYDSADIIQQSMLIWSISKRMSYKYLKDAYEKFARHEDRKLEYKKHYHLAIRRKLFRELQEKDRPEGAKAALAILKDMAVLDGTWVERHDVTSAGKAFKGFGFLPGEDNENDVNDEDAESEPDTETT